MHFLSKTLPFAGLFAAVCTDAQQSISIQLPDAQITADRLVRGDGDTYGVGDWHAKFKVKLEDNSLKIDGKIEFTEKANDFTTIVGEYHRRVKVAGLENCRHCWVSLDATNGTVSGPNIGARGYRWFNGKGLIKRAKIQTDTFGSDVGNAGGTVQFAPIRVLIECPIVGLLRSSITPAMDTPNLQHLYDLYR